MKTVYTGLGRQAPVQPGHGALFLSIFALSAYFYLPTENSEVVTSGSDAVRLAIIWSKAALEVLDHVKATASEGVETIQAYIILSYVTYHLDGFTAKGRHLRSAAVSVAVDIGLHRVDAAGTGPRMRRGASPRDTIDQEVKRRVFWHIVSTDWLQSTLSGPQEGMYLLHPNHIQTGLPKDCDDDSILMDGENHPADGSRLTSMTWYLTRVQLAQLCRQVTDTLPLGISELVQLPYDHVIDLDKRFLDFFSGLPFYLRQDGDSREKSRAIETAYPRIPGMRYCIITAAHSRRCRLHQKFLLRHSSDPRYAYSRQACLESARAVVRAYDDSKFGYASPAFASARMAMAVHFTHLGLVVLVMDLCFNRGLPGEEERKAEVKAALSLLEEARDVSSLISQSLNALQGMLRKHNIDLGASSQIDHHPQQPDSANEESADIRMQIVQPDFDFPASDVLMEPSFDEFWQFAVQDDINQDSGVWDNFFSALDSRPL
ncbi:uncharacterized protein E0L32_000441 [Thyridium curvatum]|uniref:Xylanolytic transcriptional activator regulatory domain-containing protein n=1 Tax=Thyridium curvatum TaxID=1093900 RepID=A0A507B2S3_9PEZI|nr:uncharacterized protein E0L32_000441 [Thyridium curvatum]TPX14047.1 hypothetical protein E0L32_000441 [Thyridium curvatum]